MTDDLRQDVDELRETVQMLRERVSELEGRLDSSDGQTATDGPLDRYDRDAKKILDQGVAESSALEIMNAYEIAGVVDKKKQKRRAKRLRQLEGE